jgi:hypothetical protein
MKKSFRRSVFRKARARTHCAGISKLESVISNADKTGRKILHAIAHMDEGVHVRKGFAGNDGHAREQRLRTIMELAAELE